jgi:RNA polymerase sigma-70 factor (family 1)
LIFDPELMEKLKKADLVAQIFLQQRDEKSFQELFNYFFPRLTGFAFTYIQCYSISEDLVMDAFEKIWRQKAGLHKVRNIKSYLYTCVRNRCIDELRKNKEITTDRIDSYETGHFVTKRSPEHILIEGELSQKLSSVVADLPPKSKTVYMLVKEEGFTYNEAAELLNLSSKTIDYHVNYCMKRIRKEIRSYLNSSAKNTNLRIG